jgi:hypothetical protein
MYISTDLSMLDGGLDGNIIAKIVSKGNSFIFHTLMYSEGMS